MQGIEAVPRNGRAKARTLERGPDSSAYTRVIVNDQNAASEWGLFLTMTSRSKSGVNYQSLSHAVWSFISAENRKNHKQKQKILIFRPAR